MILVKELTTASRANREKRVTMSITEGAHIGFLPRESAENYAAPREA